MNYRFDGFLLDADRRELLRGDLPVTVEPQVFDVIAYLVGHAERVVRKEDIIAAV